MIKKLCIIMAAVCMITFVAQAALAVEAGPTPTKKEPIIAGVASLVIPGLGQAYVQDWKFQGKPITHFAVAVVLLLTACPDRTCPGPSVSAPGRA